VYGHRAGNISPGNRERLGARSSSGNVAFGAPSGKEPIRHRRKGSSLERARAILEYCAKLRSRVETTLRTLRDEFFFLREAPEELDGYPFTGHVAAKQSRRKELRNEDPTLADIEKRTERGVKVYHSDDGDEVVSVPGHLR
jgi:hypothetical protein